MKFIQFNQETLLKYNIASKYLLNYLYEKKIKSLEIQNTKWNKFNLISESDLLETKTKKNTTCHIICGGESLMESENKIRKEDFVMGFNFSAVANISFDMYFIEIGSSKEKLKEFSILQYDLLDYRKDNIKKLIIKNLWEGKLDPNTVELYYGKNANILLDCLAPPIDLNINKNFQQVFVSFLLKKKKKYLVQYSATALTCLQIASKLGFKKIVLHGLDFGGNYFFHKIQSDIPQNLKNRILFYYPENITTNHSNGDSVRSIMPTIRDTLKKDGINIYSGSKLSPLAKILDVYQNNGK